MTPRTDDPLHQLSRLPERDLDAWRAENIRHRARRELERGRWLAERPALAAWTRFYRAVVEPSVVIGLSAAHLAWAVNEVAALYR